MLNHSGSRNGATILLLHLLKWLSANTSFQFDVVTQGRGELVGAFSDFGNSRIWRNYEKIAGFLPARFRRHFAKDLNSRSLAWLLKGNHYNLIYANTASFAPYIQLLSSKAPVLWHFHEMSYALRLNIPAGAESSFSYARRFIAASKSVETALSKQFGIRENDVDLVFSFIDEDALFNSAKDARQTVRNSLGIPQGSIVVGGCGNLGWRKGTDIFLQIAARLKGDSRFHFVWVGGSSSDTEETLAFKHDVELLGLKSRCSLVPSNGCVQDYYAAMDLFALTSREDPFPLVMLEAAANSLPVICFADSGGGPEFVGNDAGVVCDYLDLEMFARQLVNLSGDPHLRRQFGQCGAAKVHSRYTVNVQGPKLLSSIQSALST